MQPCGGNVEITNDAVAKAVATDVSNAVLTSILSSDQAKDLTGSVSNEVDQKARDVFGQIGQVVSDVAHTIGDVTHARRPLSRRCDHKIWLWDGHCLYLRRGKTTIVV